VALWFLRSHTKVGTSECIKEIYFPHLSLLHHASQGHTVVTGRASERQLYLKDTTERERGSTEASRPNVQLLASSFQLFRHAKILPCRTTRVCLKVLQFF